MALNIVGPSYNLASRPASVQRTINMVPLPQEPGNERTRWVFVDVPGLVLATAADATEACCAAPAPAPAAPPIAWLAPTALNDPDGVATLGESGSVGFDGGVDFLYAGVVGYTSGTVVWSIDWSPSSGGSAPEIASEPEAGKVGIRFYNPNGTGGRGTAAISATVDGSPAGAPISAIVEFDDCEGGVLSWSQ